MDKGTQGMTMHNSCAKSTNLRELFGFFFSGKKSIVIELVKIKELQIVLVSAAVDNHLSGW